MTGVDDETKKGILALRRAYDEHKELVAALFEAADRDLYSLDFLVLGALNRSLRLTRGFCDAIEGLNFVCAAPLLRMQLDNVFRLAAAGWVVDGDAFAKGVLEGKRVSDFVGRDGARLTDACTAPGSLDTRLRC